VTIIPPRGACPDLSAPMMTGDGLLARLTLRDCIALDSFIALCAAARQHGNGTLEITARGSLQVRGLTSDSAPLFASAVAALDVVAIEGVPVIADPLAGDPDVLIDTAGLATRLRRATANARLALAPKVCVLLDGGGRLHLDALTADVRLRAIGTARASRLHVAVGGNAATATPLGSIAPDKAPDAVVRILGVIAARGYKARAVDVLRSDGIGAFRSVVDGDIDAEPHPPPRPPVEPIGRHPLGDGSVALGVALPFGHAHADALAQLARFAAGHGIHSARPAPGRALLLLGASQEATAALVRAAEGLGFVARADDARRRIVACPGRPACAAGLIAARTLATELARQLSPRGVIHISGCAKGCAHPAAAALTVVGTEHGCGIVRHGTAAAAPRYHVDPADLVAEVARITLTTSGAAHG
jgi:precorrin-3B synthase